MLDHSSAARAASSARREPPPPDIDDRLAPPETRIEYLDGKKIVTMPADRPHATKHSQIDRVVGAHVAEGYEVAVDMLTRTSKTSDFAPDVSVFPSAPDPKTRGGSSKSWRSRSRASKRSRCRPTRRGSSSPAGCGACSACW